MRLPAPALLLVAGLLAAPASAAPLPQDLVNLVPADAHLVVHSVSDPELMFLEEYTWEVIDAVRDARFDELVLEVMAEAGAPPQTISEVRAARDMLVTLLGSVDWYELVENEMAFAQRADTPVPMTLMPSMLFAYRPDPERVDKLERQLSTLMVTISGLSDGNLGYQIRKPEQGKPGPRVYQLRVKPLGDRPLLQMAVLGDKILLGVGDAFFGRALALLDGSSQASLTTSKRFRSAMGDLPEGCSQVTYVDMKAMLQGYRDGLVSLFGDIGVSGTALSLIDDLHGLVSCVDTIAEAIHAEGHTVISESWIRYDDSDGAATNPILAGMRNDHASDQLLQFVPATATSFSMSPGFDPRPLYDWMLERYHAYVPNAREHMIVWNGLQATLDMNVRDDVLSWIGSPSVRVTLPGRGSALQGDEWVSISLLEDHKAARKVMLRFEEVFTALVPPILDLAREKAGPGTPLPSVEIENAGEPTGLRRLKVVMPLPVPIPPVTYGINGRLLVSASSEDALNHVMGVAAGEYAGLEDHAHMHGTGSLPEGPLVSAKLTPWGRHMQQFREGLQVVSGMVGPMLLSAAPAGETPPEARATIKLATGVLQRVADILDHVDFLDHGVAYTVAREEGRVHYMRSATVMVDPAVRAERRRLR